MLGLASMAGGGGASTSSSATAKSGSTIGDIGFGDTTIGGGVSPLVIGLVVAGIVAAIALFKH